MGNYKTTVLGVFFLLFVMFPFSLSADSDTVHNFSFLLDSLAHKDSLADTEYTAELLWRPEVFAYNNWSEILFIPSFVFPIDGNAEFGANIEEMRFTFFPSKNFTVQSGRYIHDSSFAMFFEKTAFFRAVDYKELLEGNIDSAAVPAWLIEGSYYMGDWYLRVSLEPFRQELPFFEVDSVWFPNLGFPEELYSPFAPDEKIELEELHLIEPESSARWDSFLQDIGGALEAGGSIGMYDFMLLAYTGRDNVPLYSVELVLKNLVDDYHINLRPVKKRIHSFGAAIRRAFGSVVLFSEGAWTLDKPLMEETIYSTPGGFETESYTAGYLEFSLGSRWEWWEKNLLLAAEYTNGYIIDENPKTVMPFFQQMALGSLMWSPFDGRLNVTTSAVVSIDDGSIASNFGVECLISGGKLSFSFSLPLFFGTEDSSFGQYRDILYPTFSSTLRY